MSYVLTPEERETVFLTDAVSTTFQVSSSDPKWIEILDELVENDPVHCKCTEEYDETKFYEIDQSVMKFKKRYKLSDDEKKKRSERLTEARSKVNKKESEEKEKDNGTN